MTSIFINYRTSDVGYAPNAVRGGLAAHFGAEHVFLAARSIPLGAAWPPALLDAAAGCRVLLALLGSRWSSATTDTGDRCLDDPDDLVRAEIRAALDHSRVVVPVLFDDAPNPADRPLPGDIAALARSQAFRVHRRSMEHDIDALAKRLRAENPDLPRPAESVTTHTETRFGAVTGRVDKLFQIGQMTVNGDFNA
ncbi:TIR domain-containing protein [Actinokineospora auranticolor]|uniref:TIR domain-containing protein n=1 Tax=Actinokineospora auranticolor TaxID=155976 RepID=A0A2S6GQX3_9PSEU|nr:TIR domain-containing protein [Actinokineospora auranticolor]PPK67596.1 TIR domain-containing protein [Actinokineospora auranticolor]